MTTTTRRIAFAGITAAGIAAAIALSASPAQATAVRAQRAVFVESDNIAGNTVVVYDRNADGTLTQAGTYATGGLGGVLAGSVVDHTASQGSLAVDRANNLLYAVNAGRDNQSAFDVGGDRLLPRQ